MSKISEHSIMLVVFLIIVLAITASGFYEQHKNSIPLPAGGVQLARWPYDSAVLPAGTASSPPPPMPPPIAYFSPSAESTFHSVEITFDASVSYDPFGQIASYEWDFGDGSEGKGAVVNYSYSSAGNYEVTLAVTGALGATASISKPITIDAGIKGDVSDDGKISSNDAVLTLRIVAGLAAPTDYQKWASDVNGDGRTGSDDAILVLRKAIGSAAPDASAIVSGGGLTTIALADMHGAAGEKITVPLEVDNTEDVAGGQASIIYDPAVLRAVDVSSDAGILLVSSTTEAGAINIAFAGSGTLKDQTIARIEFHILADDISPLSLQQVELYGPTALPLNSRSIDREFRSWTMPSERDELLQNFPNPFNPETWIPYQLKEDRHVTIRIYGAAGNLVRQLDMGHKPAGLYVNRDKAAYWDGNNSAGETVASGVYFYSIQAGDFHATRKLTVLR
ncbi:PKD domain-containing protein [Candidatus Poribacteria bacterium]